MCSWLNFRTGQFPEFSPSFQWIAINKISKNYKKSRGRVQGTAATWSCLSNAPFWFVSAKPACSMSTAETINYFSACYDIVLVSLFLTLMKFWSYILFYCFHSTSVCFINFDQINVCWDIWIYESTWSYLFLILKLQQTSVTSKTAWYVRIYLSFWVRETG